MNKIPLNQCYQEERTFKEYPEIKKIYNDYKNWCLNDTDWGKYGRAYDSALTLYNIDFKDKICCELCARDSFFSPYLTQYVKKIYASDIFLGWGDLGDLNYWGKLWKKNCFNPERHISEKQDMQNLTYDENFFDVVVSFSAIEHVPENGDMLAANEMFRICKPGGIIVIGTELSDKFEWFSGSYFYTKKELFERIIDQTRCLIMGEYNFNYEESEKIIFSGKEFTSCILFLKKPEQ